jgi:hypothetical protein
MKNVLKLGLAVVAIAALSACGGGDSSDAADAYVGNWKSKCASYVASSGRTFYQTYTLSFAKTTPAEILGTYSNSIAYYDSGCTSSAGAKNNYNGIKINIGAKTTFLGAQADAMVYTLVSTGEARPGFITASDTAMNIVVNNNNGTPPAGWGAASPYTKQ